MRVLPEAIIPELPNLYRGKVRDCYDLPDGQRILIASDRISAFDRILAAIPHKGAVLTQIARFWFDATCDICPNHAHSYPDPNVVIAQRLEILPVEVVVRGFLAGSTGTSILTLYRQGLREMYGHRLPDGLRDNEKLRAPILTPTSKEFDGGHDRPLAPAEIVEGGILSAADWDAVSALALALFSRGQRMAATRGLILADTKYEFGRDPEGRIVLADEIHTPDSSRYWREKGYAAAFEAGTRPPSFDKDVIRSWVSARCDPYQEPVPEIPATLVAETSAVYLAAFEAITGAAFVPDLRHETVLARVRANLQPWFAT